MKETNKTKTINYFEEVYLGKTKNEISFAESKRLQKLLGTKALKNSGGTLKIGFNKKAAIAPQPKFIMDIDNFLLPFDL